VAISLTKDEIPLPNAFGIGMTILKASWVHPYKSLNLDINQKAGPFDFSPDFPLLFTHGNQEIFR